MTFSCKRRLRGIVTAAAATLCLGAAVMQPASAADSDGVPAIDKPFEDAVVKHFQKRFFDRIDASAEQRKKLTEIIGKRVEESRPVREELRQKARELKQMMSGDSATDEQLRSKAGEIRALRSQLMDARFETLLQVRAVLTPDQKEQISKRISAILASGRLRG